MNQEEMFKTTVGSSNRTLGKHSLLNKILGREIGIMSHAKPAFIYPEYVILDLCAGNGLSNEFSGTSSPQIITKHVKNSRNGNIYTYFFEKDVNTHTILQSQFSISLHQNAFDLIYLPVKVEDNAACFIHCDPNLITDWAVNKNLLNNCPRYTTSLITLGCNVGGLKRLPFEKRVEWFDRLDDILSFLPSWHDALLIALKGDKAQWAYLVTGPQLWHDKGYYQQDALKSFKYWNFGIEFVQFKRDLKNFKELRDRLFLTKKEIQDHV